MVWSYILDYENSRNIFSQKRSVIQKWRGFAALDIEESAGILEIANTIRKTGIKNTDSLHLACALAAKCDYFISVDDRVLKYSTDTILICNPVEFVRTWEEFIDDE